MTDFASDFGLDPHTALGPHMILGTFILFCRVGACLMLMPGFSSPQIPTHVRLFLALAVTLALAPLLLAHIPLQALSEEPLTALRFIGAELLVGATIGMLGRLFLLALETMATAGAMAIGLSNPFGVVGEESEILPPFVTLITLSATALIFVMDLHWEVFRGIADSYVAIPVKENFDVNFSLLQFSKLLTSTFQIALRISAPFIIYTVIIQTTVSVINRLTPYISIYFISTPFVIFGGLFLTYMVVKSFLDQFMVGFLSWLSAG
ncbi:flagellar biosynthetic protein FliR [Methylocapsa sp. S129]|uniref:flagellar biosynthetic protein FliR n=1 Tax=Methylocapsa sp. S129 TaxID=1641869 RepID=UPI001AEE45BB|nr:flagellar biosynthetic protein FliR [Methylocapsa sp. S129]